MEHRLDCIVGGREFTVGFGTVRELEGCAERLGLRRAATYLDRGVTVHQYFEPDFEGMAPAERDAYSMSASRPGAECL